MLDEMELSARDRAAEEACIGEIISAWRRRIEPEIRDTILEILRRWICIYAYPAPASSHATNGGVLKIQEHRYHALLQESGMILHDELFFERSVAPNALITRMREAIEKALPKR